MTSTALKLLALFLMFIDHIAEFIPGAPLWFHWLGRISAPLFLFCMVWGLYYTHDKKRYLLRMYLCGGFMATGNILFNSLVKDPYFPIINNIFVTLFLVGILVSLVEYTKQDKKKGLMAWGAFLLFEVVSTVLGVVLSMKIPLYGVMFFVGAWLPNLLFNGGSLFVVLLGVLLYYNRKEKRSVTICYTIFCVAYFFMSVGNNFTYENIFEVNYQWMMIASLPFMLLYNGKKGKGFKYLFYIFYPAHIYLLFLIGNYLF